MSVAAYKAKDGGPDSNVGSNSCNTCTHEHVSENTVIRECYYYGRYTTFPADFTRTSGINAKTKHHSFCGGA